jgi:hypothetical protein
VHPFPAEKCSAEDPSSVNLTFELLSNMIPTAGMTFECFFPGSSSDAVLALTRGHNEKLKIIVPVKMPKNFLIGSPILP